MSIMLLSEMKDVVVTMNCMCCLFGDKNVCLVNVMVMLAKLYDTMTNIVLAYLK